MNKSLYVEWKDGSMPKGKVEVFYGGFGGMSIADGEGSVNGENFTFTSQGCCRLKIDISDANINIGACSTLVTVLTELNPFSFLLRDVCKEYPIYIPAYGVVVTEDGDGRSYAQIEEEIKNRNLMTYLQRIDAEDEESYLKTSARTKSLPNNTCLGIPRDPRAFSLGIRDIWDEQQDWIFPWYNSDRTKIPDAGNVEVRYNFTFGRGLNCRNTVERRLEEGVLPILHAKVSEEEIAYNITVFAAYETGAGSGETDDSGEVVLFYRIEAVNTGESLKYAHFKVPVPNGSTAPSNISNGIDTSYDGKEGFGIYEETGKVFFTAKLDGEPMPQEEMTVLIRPGGVTIFEMQMPHSPITVERAKALTGQSFKARHAECREFWINKLGTAARFMLPEQRIDEMVRAGLLHLDLVTYRTELEGDVAPNVGLGYPPIGSESTPMILFYDSMGWHDVARQSIKFFLDRQRDDGSIQIYFGYMIETGAVLWCVCEHYRYTRDIEWLKEIKPKLLKACKYFAEWSERNKREELRGKGYGMLDGKYVDMEDPFHAFMLNGYACAALEHTAQILKDCDPAAAAEIELQAREFKENLRSEFFCNMAKSSVMPLSDGSWCPSASPWAEYKGPVCLLGEGGVSYDHAYFVGRDSLIGPSWLIFQEVIDHTEPAAGFLLNIVSEHMHVENVGVGQPYYSRHPWIHLRRGEVKAFLKAYYSCFSTMADRETYTFNEDCYKSATHKTHEEAWFLMETRWMLYMEEGGIMRLLPGIPRAWMEHGKRIDIENAASYFGHFSLHVRSELDQGYVEAEISFDDIARRPRKVALRLPHPQCRKAVSTDAGRYDAETETVMIENFKGHAKVLLVF